MKVWTSSLERGIEAGRRLVEEQQRRARQEGPGDGDLLLHAPAHLLQRPRQARLGDAEPGQDADGSRRAWTRVEAVQASGVDEVLVGRQLLEERGVDRDPVDEPLDGHLVALDVVAEDLDPARRRGSAAC